MENEMTLLRPLQKSDFEFLLPFALDEPELWTYSLVSASGKDGMLEYIRYAIKERESGKEYPFIVFDKRSGRYAGCTRFYDIQPSADTLQLGFTWYGKAFQGTGLNKHCKYLLLQLAFEQWKTRRVEFRADFRNKRSLAAMKGIGCVEEGVLRSHAYCNDGTRRDSMVLSILMDEWNSHLKSQLNSQLILGQQRLV